MNFVVSIPDKLASRLSVDGLDLERQALEALVVEGYRSGRVTTDDLREALGLEMPDEVVGFLKVHGLSEAPIGTEADRRDDALHADMVSVPAEEYARLKRRERQVHLVEDLPEDIIAQIARTEMDQRHDHLDDLLKDWTP